MMSANPVLPLASFDANLLLPSPATHCSTGPVLCDDCMRMVAEKAAKQLLFREFEAAHASDAFYVSWLGGGKPLRRVDELRERTVELCRANDLAELMFDMASKPRAGDDPEFDQSHFLPSEAVLEPLTWMRRSTGITPYLSSAVRELPAQPAMSHAASRLWAFAGVCALAGIILLFAVSFFGKVRP